MDIIDQNYLVEETFKYKDETTGELKDGGKWYSLDAQKVIHNEMWQLNELETLSLTPSSAEIQLPTRKGLYYEGMGVCFKYQGKAYENVKANQAILEQALKSGAVEWYFNGNQFRKEGGKGTLTLTVGSTDNNARLFIQTSVTKPVLSE